MWVELYLYRPSVPAWPVTGLLVFFFVNNSRVAIREIPHFSWNSIIYYHVHNRPPRVSVQFMVYQSPYYRRYID